MILRLVCVFCSFFIGISWVFSHHTPDSLSGPRADYVPHVDEAELSERLMCIEGAIPLKNHYRVRSFITYFTVKNRHYVKKMQRLSTRYFPLFERYLRLYGLPDELKYLPIVESGLRPDAVSNAGAVGLWQFIPSTARAYGLELNDYKDDRRDPQKATDAACRYLRDLYGIFHDWELALAAFNSGPGNVRKAIRRSGRRSFWGMYRYLPRETRSYVPQFVALTYAMRYSAHHNLYSRKMEFLPPLVEVSWKGALDLRQLSTHLGLCGEDIASLNPQYLWGVIPDTVSAHSLYVPASFSARYAAFSRDTSMYSLVQGGVFEQWLAIRRRLEMLATYGRRRVVYRVRRGDVLGTIAARHRVRVSEIRKWNRLKSNLIRIGQRLAIWVPKSARIRTEPPKSLAKGATRVYRVRKGDNLSHIAQKENVSVRDLKKWNRIKGHRIYAGQTLRILSSKTVQKSPKHHLVRRGDTLWEISLRYPNVSISDLRRLNGLRGNNIYPGQHLRLWP